MSNIEILRRGLEAALRWTAEDTAKIVLSERDLRKEGFSEEFCNDVFLMREALKVQP